MLDDFFTLTEIKDGLTSPSRVAKLVKIMQSGNLHAGFSEAASQWSVGEDINGLHYFNLCLRNAPCLLDKDHGSAMEESIGVLLDCLEKLGSKEEHMKSSGIAVTIKQLCDDDDEEDPSGNLGIDNMKKLQHGVTLLTDTERSQLEPVPKLCDHLFDVSPESTVCHTEASVSVRDSNELIEEDAGDEYLVLPNSDLKLENQGTDSDEIASKLDNPHDHDEVGDAQQSNQKITPFRRSIKFSKSVWDFDLNHGFDSSDEIENLSPQSIPISDHGKNRKDLLDFDLNVSDSVVDIADDTVVTPQIPAWCRLPSSESSIEVSSRESERHKLDLNCHANDTEPLSNELQNHSTVSSSSVHSSKINFDLNQTSDDEYGFADKGMSSTNGASSWSKPAFVLMGSRVEIDRHIPNENSSISSVNCSSRPDFFLNKPAVFSVPPPTIFHGFPAKPSTPSSFFCGSGKSTQLRSSLFFFDTNQDSDAAGSSNRCSFQNFNLGMIDRRKGSLESSRPGVNQNMDEQHLISQYPNSNGPKRKEPNDGWQTHQFNYKMQHIRR